MDRTVDWSLAYQGTANGYKIVPVRIDGTPCFGGIYDEGIVFRDSDIAHWEKSYPTANLGVVCGPDNVCVIDVDVDYDDVNRKLYQFIASYLKIHVLRKRSGSSRFAVITRADESLEWLTKASSDRYQNPLTGGEQVVEFLGRRKYLFVAGQHRKDKRSFYEMPEGRSILDVPVSSLTLLTEEILDKIFSFYRTIVPKGWTRIERGRKTGKKPKKEEEITTVVGKDWRSNLGLGIVQQSIEQPKDVWEKVELERKPYTEEEIQYMLDHTDGSGREDWLNVGMALHKHYDGSMEGLIRWDEWAKQFSGYKGFADQRYHWGTFRADGNMSLRSIERKVKRQERLREIYKEAEEAVIPELQETVPKRGEEAMDFMMTHYVMIAEGAKVGDLSKPVSESIKLLPQMREFCKNRKMEIETTSPGGKVITKEVPCFELWLTSPARIEAWDTTYLPGGGRMVGNTKTKITYYNTYNPPSVVKVEGRSHLKWFLNHMKYLFPRGGDKWMINWMAQLCQDPAHRYRVAPFSISVFEGTGRGWLTRLLSKLVGYSNYATVKDIGDIIRPGAKSGYLDGTVLLVFNEVYTTGKLRFQVLSQIKTILSDDIQEIDVKYGKHTYNQQIYTRCFFQSNHIDGLIIDDNDSRIQPFINREKPKDKEYYTHLYRLLDNEQFVNEVYSFLLRQDINVDMLTHSQPTDDREMVIRGTKSPTALAFYEFKIIVGENGVFTDEMMTNFINDYIHELNEDGGEDGAAFVNLKELRVHRNKNITHQGRAIQYKGKRIIVRSFGPIIEEREERVLECFNKTIRELNSFMEEFTNRVTQMKEGQQ